MLVDEEGRDGKGRRKVGLVSAAGVSALVMGKELRRQAKFDQGYDETQRNGSIS